VLSLFTPTHKPRKSAQVLSLGSANSVSHLSVSAFITCGFCSYLSFNFILRTQSVMPLPICYVPNQCIILKYTACCCNIIIINSISGSGCFCLHLFVIARLSGGDNVFARVCLFVDRLPLHGRQSLFLCICYHDISRTVGHFASKLSGHL